MTTFNDKEKGAENKFARDQELEFKIHARRNKIFGLWLAEKLGLSGVKEQEYASAMVSAGLGKTGDETMLEKAKKDLAEHKKSVSDHDLRAALHHAQETAKKQVTG